MVERLFLAVPRGCLRFVILVFPNHTHFLLMVPLNCCGKRDGRTDGRSGPTTRPAFAKAKQVKIESCAYRKSQQ